MDELCVVHYDSIKTSTALVRLSKESFDTLTECKGIRESLGGANHHERQCQHVPTMFGDEAHFYHRECYQKFIYARTLLKRKRAKEDESSGSSKRPSRASDQTNNGNPRQLFPNECMICSKQRIKVRGKFQFPTKILTKTAEDTLKRSATLRKDEPMIAAVTDVDLIAKEFSKHEKCYLDYTRVARNTNVPSPSVCETEQDLGDFSMVCEVVEQLVLGKQQCISMDSIVSAYGINEGDRQQRYRLKVRLQEKYGQDLLFISHEKHSPQIVISKICLETQTLSNVLEASESNTVKKAATLLRDAVTKVVQEAPTLPWPPTIESLKSSERNPPQLLELFYKKLLSPTSSSHAPNATVERLADSFSQDVLYAVSKGEFITLKHAAMGLGLHSLTGQKLPLRILSSLGHSINYDRVCEIETAQAELIQHFQAMSLHLPIIPATSENKVTTTFWWDNFDRNIETASGAGSIHNTPGIVFQEESEGVASRNEAISIPRSKRRSLLLEDAPPVAYSTVHPKTEPPTFAGKTAVYVKEDSEAHCSSLLILWKSLRHMSATDQVNPRFAGWIILLSKKTDSKETKLTYMPPIQKPITEYAAFFEMFFKSRELAKQANMSYTHITLDVGAAIKAYHVIWNNPTLWSDIIIHLGDFHAMMTYFGVIGTFVEGSGFEDVLFQAGLCSSGSITGFLSGKHYNRNWLLHEAFSEALARLFQEQFIPEIPDTLIQLCQDQPASVNVKDLITDASVQAYMENYSQQLVKCLHGEFGKTPQFWAIYMMMVDRQQKLHHAVSTNNYNLRLLTWRKSLAMCFATNRIHYSRYGTFYVLSLEHLDSTHPGAKAEIEESGLSVRRNTLGIGQAVDLAGEQSYMKSAKTAGGITQFATKETTVAKWAMNRPFQARFAETLIEISGLSNTTSCPRKCLRPSEIIKSNKMVENIITVLTTQFMNPFQQDIDKSKLYNLVSGCPVQDEICESLLSLEEDGIDLMKSFENRLTTDPPTEAFFDPIKRKKWKSWKDTAKKIVVKKDRKEKELAFQRDILGILVARSYQYNSGIDIDAVLCYPLAPVSVPLSTPDGSMRKTVKSKLFTAAMTDLRLVTKDNLPGPEKLNTYFLDVAASVRSIVGKPDTVRELAMRILDTVPSQYKSVYMVCDTYEEDSIKGSERIARGTSNRYFLKSPDMKVPYDFASFLCNGSNKEMLFDLIQQSIEERKSILKDRTVYFSNKQECTMITEAQATVVPELTSNHEEADTKLVALVCAANIPQGDSVMIRSPSGDIDILTLFVAHDFGSMNVYLDNGTGKSRKIIEATSSQLSEDERNALPGMHAFTGNDYLSSFFRKGKSACWKALLKRREFIEAFGKLGIEDEVDQSLLEVLEKFVCCLYGYPRLSNVNDVRKAMFWEKFEKKKKIVDLSLLPPCKENLQYHIMRSNYVSYIFRHADQLILDVMDPASHGWDSDRKVIWSDECYPQNVAEFLLDGDANAISSDDEDAENEMAAFGDDLDDDLENISDFE